MRKFTLLFLIFTLLYLIIPSDTTIKQTFADVAMGGYCYSPPSIATSVPPLVMLVMERDHKLYYEAYNDASDLDEDGKIDVGYKHSINYYGYFDPYKCYSYDGSKFVPVSITTNKYCNGNWSGNFLNWLTMSRMDVLKKVLYGGYRSVDSASETVLEATYIPQDAHSWGKEYSGSDINQLTPFSAPSSGKRHLFCITSTSSGDTRKIRVLLNSDKRIWDWASKERPVCDNSLGPPQDYYIRVRVCNTSVGLEPNCKRYPQGTYKPIGLLQKYGESEIDQNGNPRKWCSKSLKSCNTDRDCNIATDGLCIEQGKIYFGLLTGSYTKNVSGGVLRKNIWSIQDEINAQTGFFQTSENTEGNIIQTINRMKIIGFRYDDFSYQAPDGGTCGWITDHPLNEGECKDWGNPVAEMMYEALRYMAGKTNPTSIFTYSGTQDSGLNLSKPEWGIRKGSNTYRPYDLFPICAKPFMLVFSDINNSYDSDSLPGSAFGGISTDLVGMNVSTLANTISSRESISGNYFIGQAGSLYDFICSPKNLTGFSNIRGLCPEEPTKQGSFYPASIAYYGNTRFKDNFSGSAKPFNVKTYSIALASSIPDISIKVGNKTVRISPFAKSISGCLNVYNNCFAKCSVTRDSQGNLKISNCQSGAFCPTNQIVDFYVEQVSYDSNNNLTYAKFRINFEDVEQGADHDMDAIVLYEITPVGSNQIKVKLTSEYASGCIDQVIGFNISGTTEDGSWLVVKDKDAASDGDTPNVVAGMPLTWEKTFTISSTVAAGQLKPPLWYAAKWGGFDDQNGNNIPDLSSEWDEDGNGIPDTYFYVVNPLKMEQELENALTDILRRASSGSTVATLASRTGISSLVIQPYFYPKYQREDGTELSWLGFLRSFWVDLKQNLREDTIVNKVLDMAQNAWDKIIQFVRTGDETKIAVLAGDTDSGSNACQLETIKDLNQVKPVFDSGCWLAQNSASARNIKFNKDGTLTDFTTNEALYLKTIWQTVDSTIDPTKASCIIRYLRGENLSSDSTCNTLTYVQRTRELNINSFCNTNLTATWKLGDIINSTPSVVSDQPVNIYHIKYGDTSYVAFIRGDDYKNRPTIAFVGANDGMLHAFRVGTVVNQADPFQPSKLQNAPNDAGNNLIGKEEWAFIPKNAIPYLIWYGKSDYCHVPTVDYRTFVVDAKINGTWKTLLIGAMGFGGKALPETNPQFSSSIFVLDITNPTSPSLLWEKSLDDKTLTLSFPAVLKIGDNWYIVAGTGPKDPRGTSFTTAKLYFFNLNNGTKIKELQIGGNNPITAAVGDIMPVDVDFDYSDDAIYLGTYTTNSGDFYRIYLKGKSVSALSDNDIKKAVSVSRPVFAAPNFTVDELGKLWVFFGTGRYLGDSDKTISYTNYFVGFKDECMVSGCNYVLGSSGMTNTTTTQVYATVTELKKICSCASSGCSQVDVVYDTTPVSTQVEPQHGWYYQLTQEAVISQPTVFGGNVDVLVFAPPQDICAYGGNTKLMALYYKTGTPNPRPAVFSSLATSGTQGTVTVYAKIPLGSGAPPFGNPFQITQGTSSREYTKFVQVSTGVVLRLQQQVSPGYESRFISWIEK